MQRSRGDLFKTLMPLCGTSANNVIFLKLYRHSKRKVNTLERHLEPACSPTARGVFVELTPARRLVRSAKLLILDQQLRDQPMKASVFDLKLANPIREVSGRLPAIPRGRRVHPAARFSSVDAVSFNLVHICVSACEVSACEAKGPRPQRIPLRNFSRSSGVIRSQRSFIPCLQRLRPPP